MMMLNHQPFNPAPLFKMGVRLTIFLALLAGLSFTATAQKMGDYNAGILSVDTPNTPICTGNQAVYASFENEGHAIIDSIHYRWYFNGQLQKEDTVQVQLDTIGGNAPFSTDTSLLLGNADFTSGTNSVEIRIDKVNGHQDTVNSNDTFRHDFEATGLNGAYSIGGSNPEYSTFQEAINDLNERGVCGPVDINVQSGTYTFNNTISVNQIEGASATNDIEFIGQGTGASKIEGTLQNELFEFNSTGYMSFRDLSMENKGSNFNTQIMALWGETHDIKVENCALTLNFGLSPGMVIETHNSSSCHDLSFTNNTITGGNYSFQLLGNPENIHIANNQLLGGYFGGISTTSGNQITIDSNQITNYAGYLVSTAILLEESTNAKVRNNTVDSTWINGIDITGSSQVEIGGNRIRGFGTFTFNSTNGISIDESQNLTIQNNFIGSSFGSANGIYSQLTDTSVKVFHNSIRVNNTGLYLSRGAQLKFFNNNVKTTDGGNPLVYEENYAKGRYNGNNYDFPANGILYENDRGNTHTSLSAWTDIPSEEYRRSGAYDNEVAFTQDANFTSSQDLHLNPNDSFPKGIDLGIAEDIDGDARCGIAPTIGADESAFSGQKTGVNVDFPDTVSLKSPFQPVNNGLKTGHLYDWYLNGKLVVENMYEPQLKAQNLGPDTFAVIDSACNGVDTLEKVVQVKAAPNSPVANFVADRNELSTGQHLPLKDLSQNGIAGWEWQITPGNSSNPPVSVNYNFAHSDDENRMDADSTQNPHVNFIEPGQYSVCLRVYNYDSSGQKRWDTLCKNNYLKVSERQSICNANSTEAQSGALFDDGGPDQLYQSSQDDERNTCSFTIDPCGDSVALTIKNLDLFNAGCGDEETDYLRIYDGKDASGTPLWNSSNQCSQGITGQAAKIKKIATSGAAHIEFSKRTEETAGIVGKSGKGFAINWEAKGGAFKAPKAAIKGPDTVCINGAAYFEAQQLVQNQDFGSIERAWHLNGFDAQNPATGDSYYFNPQIQGFDTLNVITEECTLADTATKLIFVESPQTIDEVAFQADIVKPMVNQGIVKLTNQTGSCANDVTWQISPDSFRFVNGTDENSPNPEIIFEDTGDYDVALIAESPGDKDTLTKKDYISPVQRCRPEVQLLNPDIGISWFSIGQIDHESTIGEKGYSDFTDQGTAVLEKGVKVGFRVDRETGYNEVTRKIWIDYNGDGDFTDSNSQFNELVAQQYQSKAGTWQDTFQVKGLKTGATRLRVGVFFGDGNGPCGQPQFGEYEDYRVRISEDITPPEISLDGRDTIYMRACEPLAGKDTGATATDNFLGNITDSLNVTSHVDSSEPGTYTIDYEVFDADSNRSFKQRQVIVKPDRTEPGLTLNGKDSVIHPVNRVYRDSGYTANDNCSGLATIDTMGTVNSDTIGQYQITYKATDSAGNTVSRSRTVKVIDTVAPSIQLGPDTVRVQVDSAFEMPEPQISDNYWPEEQLSITQSGEVNTGEIGTYPIAYQATDGSGNGPVVKELVVIVQDTIKPEVFAKVRDSVLTLPVHSTLIADDLVSAVKDNHYRPSDLGTSKAGSYFNTFPDGEADSLGSFRATFAYTDPSGNTGEITQRIEVVDQTAPSLNLTGPSLVKVSRWEETSYVDSIRVTDNYYDTNRIRVRKTGSYFTDYIANNYPGAPAMYEITYQARDSSGNWSNEVYRYVRVQESTTSISNEGKQSRVKVYPNPTDGEFKLQTDFETNRVVKIAILDPTGKKIKQISESGSTFRFDLSDFASGIYQISVKTGGQVVRKRLLIQ